MYIMNILHEKYGLRAASLFVCGFFCVRRCFQIRERIDITKREYLKE